MFGFTPSVCKELYFKYGVPLDKTCEDLSRVLMVPKLDKIAHPVCVPFARDIRVRFGSSSAPFDVFLQILGFHKGRAASPPPICYVV